MLFANILEHVLDTRHWHIAPSLQWEFHVPYPLTKYIILMLLAAAIILAVFIPLARRVKSGEPTRGLFWNAMEGLLTFIRDNVAKPYIPHHADHYVPYLWTIFLFILLCNLFGMIPALGSPTASISVTVALATVTFLYIHGSAIKELGFVHYLQAMVPTLDMPLPLKICILLILYPIEIMGNLIRAGVLAVRLFANMFAGHLVIASLMLFIIMAKNSTLFWPVSFATAMGVTAMSLLELFVAFLQAFIFTFLTALFLGAAIHPEH